MWKDPAFQPDEEEGEEERFSYDQNFFPKCVSKQAVREEELQDCTSNAGKYTAGKYTAGKYTTGKYTAGKYTAGKYTTGKYTAGKYTAGKYTAGKYTANKYTAENGLEGGGIRKLSPNL